MIILFCGLPGSGKSTIAKKLARKLERLGSLKLIVSDQISGRVYRKIFKQVKENIEKVDYLILDATFYKKKWRDKIYALAKGKVFTIYLECALETCLRRNKKRRPSIPEKAIYILRAQFEKPRKPDLLINTDKVSSHKAVQKILFKIKILR